MATVGEGNANPSSSGGKGKSAPSYPTNAPQTIGDTTVIFLVCCSNFANSVFTVSIISYLFWVGVAYVVGATVLASGWSYSSPIVNKQFVCAATTNVFTLVGLWFFQGIAFLGTCWAFSTVQTGSVDDFEHLTVLMKVMGFFVKSFPTWIRLLHLFNFCQLQVIFLDLLILSECNFATGRWIVAAAVLIWWLIVMFGVYAKRRIFMPPYLYDPLRPGIGLVRELHKLLRGFGP